MENHNIQTLIEDVYPEVVKIRRLIHRNPELSGEEYRTAEFIFSILKKFGYRPKYYLNKTAVIAKISSGSGNGIVLRADIDALPIKEANIFTYRSENQGIMHACGHDMHTAILLGVAYILNVIKNKWLGTVYLLFQPSEEVEPGGASELISCNAVPYVDSIFGLHVNTDHKTGTVGIKEGLDFSGVIAFDVVIKGKGGHGATPEAAIDPIMCASTLILQLQTLISRETSPFSPVVLTIGQLNAGTMRNVIPDEASLRGTIRCHSLVKLQKLVQRIDEMADLTAKSFKARAKVMVSKAFPPTNNDPEIAQRFIHSFQKRIGKRNVIIRENPIMYAEDFAYYQEKMKGLFIHLGVRPAKGKFNGCGLHSAQFNPDEMAMKTGMLAHINYVFSELDHEGK